MDRRDEPAGDVATLSQRALECHRGGRLDEAIAAYRHLLERPEAAEQRALIQFNLGTALQALGRWAEAEAAYRAAVERRPDLVEAHFNLALVGVRQRRFAHAAEDVRRVLALQPDIAAAHHLLGVAQTELGEHAAAFHSFRAAIRLAPDQPHFWASWAECIETLGIPAAADPALHGDLARLLEHPTTRPQGLSRPILQLLLRSTVLGRISDDLRGGKAIVYAEAAAELSTVALLLSLMVRAPISLVAVELAFTRLRAALLDAVLAGASAAGGLPFTTALALQCFLNEYVFAETADEAEGVERLAADVGARLGDGRPVPAGWLAALGAYRPLHRFSWADGLRAHNWPAEIQLLIQRQVAEPREEEALKPLIARLTPLSPGVSDIVRGQYEANPFPRWQAPVLYSQPQPMVEIFRTILPDIELPRGLMAASVPEILIAGCGTGLNALYVASQFAGAQLLAVDLSLASLAYAQRKTRELGIRNISYGQADILELRGLGRQFDIIDSMGVLHHLADPLAGWRVLVDILRPHGLMRIGLYSELGRRGVVRARELIAARSIPDSPEAMRAFRQEIIAADPAREPELAALVNADIYSMSELRDLVFHVQEHRYTIPQIEAALRTLDLEFLGFETVPETLRRFRLQYPEPGAERALSRWHAFEQENPAIFAGMYQFWCGKR